MDISDKALEKAINCFAKNQSKLARAIGVDRRYINFLRNRSKSISLDVAILIENATNGEVSCFDLASRKLLKKIMEKLSYPKLTISLAACLFLEQKETLQKRRGRPKNGDPFPHLKGRSRDLAADQIKLYSGRTLERAIFVVTHGTYDLIKAMDHKKIPVNVAHQIAKCSTEKQEQLLTMDLKAIKKELAERK